MIRIPGPDEHIAFAGRTGSGKTVAALEMLSMRDMDSMAWVIIDHKYDDNIKLLPAEPMNINTMILPKSGLYVVHPEMSKSSREDLENMLLRIFKRGRIGIYVDEGHLVGHSDAVRNIMVAGRSKRVPMMWTSQRAAWIDPFIWSQASFYRVFDLQTKNDTKRFEENFPMKWKSPGEFHSYYYDVKAAKVYHLKPASPISDTADRLDKHLRTQYRSI